MDDKKQHCYQQQVIKIEEKVLDFIVRNQLIPFGATVVVAVSGGADSLALLHFLHKYQSQWGIQVVGAHLDHCLRDEAGAQDRKLVLDYCAAAGIPLFSKACNVRQLAGEGKDHNMEGAARKARYDFLFQTADICGGAVIATAHHLDDQAETILMHLLRGSGMMGLGGMKAKAGRLIRPFLGITKEEILTYCAAYGLSYCTDASNFDTAYLRNKIRLELIPQLKTYNPQIVSSLANLGEICAAENDYLERQTAEVYEKIAVSMGVAQGTFRAEPFLLLPLPLQRRVLQSFFRMFQGRTGKISNKRNDGIAVNCSDTLSFAAVEAIRGLALGGKIILPGGVCCSREKEQFIFSYPQHQQIKAEEGFSYALGDIREQVVLTFPAAGCQVEIVPGLYDNPQKAGVKILGENRIFLPEAFGREMSVRSRREGDVFSPGGMAGTMKLKKYFINEKVPRTLRDSLPLLAKDGEVFWVMAKRFGNRCKETGEAIQEQTVSGWYLTVRMI